MFLLILLMFCQPVQARAYAEFRDDALVCMQETQKFEEKYQIKKHLLTTITSVETGKWNAKRQQKLAWPWTVNAQGKGTFFKTKAEAVREVKRLQRAGVKSIDVGCMQINLAYHPNAFKSIEEAFDPKKNVEYSAKFLTSLYKKNGKNWIKAATDYHSKAPHKAKIYKQKLVNAYASLKEAMNTTPSLFGIKAKNSAKKIASNQLYIKNKTNVEKSIAKKANAWREARLAEYRKKRGL